MKLWKKIAFFMLAVMGLASVAADEVKLPPKDKFLLVMLAGQSNMAGRGIVEDEDKVADPRVLMLDQSGKWVPAVDPVHYDKKAAGVGPAKTFGKLMAELYPDCVIGLVPTACGGSPIEVWQPGKYWEQTKSTPWDDALARVKRAQKDGTLAVILWHQGEGDCNDNRAPMYHDRLLTLLTQFRNDLNAPGVPIVIGQLSQWKTWNASKKIVDRAQRDVAAELPNAGFATSEGLTPIKDNVHFDARSQREFARRYFAEYKRIVGK